jgi:hypothetical protein
MKREKERENTTTANEERDCEKEEIVEDENNLFW